MPRPSRSAGQNPPVTSSHPSNASAAAHSTHTQNVHRNFGIGTLALGYRLQEIAHGGLGKATRRKLQTMAKALRTTGRVGPTPPSGTKRRGTSRLLQDIRKRVENH